MGRSTGHNPHHTGHTNQLGPLTPPTARADKPPSLHPTAHPVPCRQSVGTTFVTAYREPFYVRLTVGSSSLRYLRPVSTALSYYRLTAYLPPFYHVSTALLPITSPIGSGAPISLCVPMAHRINAASASTSSQTYIVDVHAASPPVCSPSGMLTPCGITPTHQLSTNLSQGFCNCGRFG